MKHTFLALLLLGGAFATGEARAARAWLLPSQTIVANSGGWVAVDAAMSDDLFSANQGALGVDALVVTGPDGGTVAAQNITKSRTRSTFDLELRRPGSYRIAVAEDAVMARWEEDGKPKRWRGPATEMATAIPSNAAKLEVEQVQRRVETFVSVGRPSELKPVGKGLEVVSLTHPNDLYAGEAATFRLLIDGKPARDVEVLVIAGGTRYRNSPDEMRLTTNPSGEISVRWPAAGLYWLDATVQDSAAAVPGVKKRRASYDATFEVLAQ